MECGFDLRQCYLSDTADNFSQMPLVMILRDMWSTTVLFNGIRYSLYNCKITVDEGMLNASTISEVKCSIHLVFAITTHSNSDNSNPLAISSLAGVPTDSPGVIQASTFL